MCCILLFYAKFLLDNNALNVSTDFLFRNFVSSKEKSSALCSQVARTRAGLKQPAASSHLFILQLLTKNKSDKRTYFLLMAGLTLQGSNSLRNFTNILTIPLLPERYAISYLHSIWQHKFSCLTILLWIFSIDYRGSKNIHKDVP